jgi:hypothetical protein
MASAADAFYDIHQQSQITGVPTSQYNAARDAFLADQGMSAGDTFGAIGALTSKGYMTGMPTLDAVIKYGTGREQGSVGNSAFYPGGTSYDIAAKGETAYNKYLDELEVKNRPGGSASISTPKLGETGMSTGGAGVSYDSARSSAMSSEPFKLTNIKGITSGSTSETSYGEQGRGDVSQDYSGRRYKIGKKKGSDQPVVANKGLKVGDLYAGLNVPQGGKMGGGK